MRDFHDASFKRLFDHPQIVEGLLRGFLPADLAAEFDFDTLEQMPTGFVGDDLRQSRADVLWRVRFRAEGGRQWLYLLVLLEFQSTVDRHMAARVFAYTGQTYLKLLRSKDALAPDGKLPPVLPVVIYNGRPRWSAPEEMGGLIAAVDGALAPFQPRQRYLLIDEHAKKAEDLPPDNVVSAQIRLEQGQMAAMGPVLRELSLLLSGPEHASLRRAFAGWMRQVVERSRAAARDSRLAGAFEALEEAGDLGKMSSLLAERIDEYIEEQIEKRSEERVRKRAEERAQELAMQYRDESLTQERALLSRLTARKFDAETAERLGALVGRVDDPERLAEIGEQVIDCATGAELLVRARRAAEQGRPTAHRRRP